MKRTRFVFPIVAGIFACLLGVSGRAIAATALTFTAQPVNSTPGAAFTTQPIVNAVSAAGVTDATFTGDITITATPVSGTPGGVITGTATVTATAGISAFGDLAIDKPGQYRLTASSPGLTSSNSIGVNIGTGVTLTELWSVQPDVGNDKTQTITGINQLRSLGANHTPGSPFAGTIYITRRADGATTQQGGTADVFYWKGNHTLSQTAPDFAHPDGRFDMTALAAAKNNGVAFPVANACWAISVADDGYVYVGDYNGNSIARFNPDGTNPVYVIAGASTFRQFYATGSGINTVIWAEEGSVSAGKVYKFTATAVDGNGAPTTFASSNPFPFDNGNTATNVNGQCVINNAGTAFYYTKGQAGNNKPSKLNMSGVADTAFYSAESIASAVSSGASIDSQDRVLYTSAYSGGEPGWSVVAADPVTGVDLTTNLTNTGTANGYTPSIAPALGQTLYDFTELARFSDRHYFWFGCNRGTAVEVSLFSTDVPAADPTNVLVDNPGTGTSLKINWTPAVDPEITGVNIYRSTALGVLGSKINSSPLTGSTYTDSPLTSGSTYYYTVRSAAHDPVMNSDYEGASTVQYAKTASLAGVPDPPSAISATDDKKGGEVVVAWTNPALYAEKINIYRSTVSGTLGTKVHVVAPITNGAAATWTDTGLTNGVPVFYTVRAANGSDQESGNNAQVTATPTDQTPPTFAGIKSITEYGMPGYRVKWDVAVDNSAPVTYKIYTGTSLATINWTTPAATTTDTKYDLKVPLAQDVFIAVRATDAVGNQETNTVTLVGTPSKVIVDSDINSPAYNASLFDPHPDAAFAALTQAGIGSVSGKYNVPDLYDGGTLQGVFWFSTDDKLGKSKYTVPIPVAGTYEVDAFWTNWASVSVPGYVYHVTYPDGSHEDFQIDQLPSTGGAWNVLTTKALTVGNLVIIGDATASSDTAATSYNVSGAIRAQIKLAPQMVNIYKAATPPTIDGNITSTKYAGVTPIFLGKHYQDVVGGPWTGPADYSGNVYALWDTNALYLAYDVTDATPFFPATADTAIFQRDSLEIYIGLTDPQDPTRTTYDAGDFQIVVSADYNTTTGVMTPKWYCPQLATTIVGTPANGEVAAKKTAKGYAFEVKIPWSELPLTANGIAIPAAGRVIGFNLSGNNTRTATSSGQDNAFVLSALGSSWQNPSKWVQATFLGTTPPAIVAGDVNMDGVVNAADAVAALKIAAGLTNSTDPTVSFNAANVRASGKIGVAEAAKIIRMVNGK